MKTFEILAFRTLQVVLIALSALVVIAIGFSIVQLAIGNIHPSTAFEF
jgi:hypothetical protein